MAININSFPRLAGEKEDANRIQRAINSVRGGEIFFPIDTYTIDSLLQIYGKNKMILKGEKGAVLLVNGSINFLNIIGSNDITVEGFIFKDKTYSDEVYFKEITLESNAILIPNTNSNIDVLISGNEFTISKNANTPQGTEQYYTISMQLDSTNEYTIQTYDGIVRGENCYKLKIRQYYNENDFKEYYLDERVVDASSPGNNRWQANYIPNGTVKIEILFSYAYVFNCDNNAVVYNLSKLRLFQATRPLPNSVDTFNISIQNSKKITILKNEFVGLKLYPIKVLSLSEDLHYMGNKFFNCFLGCVDISNVKKGFIEGNDFTIRLKSETGSEVFYTKASSRGVVGSIASSNVVIQNNYGSGLCFGAEIWYSTDLLIQNFFLENTLWGISINNSSTGNILDSIFYLKDNYIYGIELARLTRMDVENVTFKGRSYKGFSFSFTDNNAGQINIRKIHVESCMIFAQWTDDSVYFQNIYVKELMGIGFFALHGKDYSNCDLTIKDTIMHASISLKVSNLSYTNCFIKTNDQNKYLNRVIIDNVLFNGKPNQNLLNVRTNEMIADNLLTTQMTRWESQIRIKDQNNKMSSFRNSQLFGFRFREFYETSLNSRLVIKDNKIQNSIIPTHANVLAENNQLLV